MFLKRLIRRPFWTVYWQAKELFSRPKALLTDEQRKFWDSHGYLVLPGHFSREHVESVNHLIDDYWSRSRNEKLDTVIDVHIGTRQESRVRLTDAPLDSRSCPYKLNDLYLESELIRKTALEERLACILNGLLGGQPLLCNSLNFEFGSQQDFHTDSLYMTPPKGLNLVATWIALEDTDAAAGPLRYYPGSNKIKPFRFSNGRITAIQEEMPEYRRYMQEQLEKLSLQEQTFCARAGDVFIWHSQLFHGGAPIKNPKLTRKSLVCHYFKAVDLPRRHGSTGTGGYYYLRGKQPVAG